MLEPASYAYSEDVNWALLRLWGTRRDATILDVGCGFATTSERLRRLGNRVTGIESNAQALAVASTRLDQVIDSDLRDRANIGAQLGPDRFDAVIFADVLEHLDWPGPILRDYLRFLAPGGVVIVSLPNVGLWSTRFGLLAGRFEYADTGVLDRTHLRFFTRSSARRLLAQAGLRVTREAFNPGLLRPFVPLAKRLLGSASSAEHDPSALLESPLYQGYLKTVYPIERAIGNVLPGLLAFQMIFEAKPQ